MMATQEARHSGVASVEQPLWLLGSSSSTRAVYWHLAGSPDSSQEEPPVNQFTILLEGYVNAFRDDGQIFFWQVPTASCISMVKQWFAAHGHSTDFPDTRQGCLDALQQILSVNGHVLALQLWSDEQHAFVLEVPPSKQGPPAALTIPPAVEEWSPEEQGKHLDLLPHEHLRRMYTADTVPSLAGPQKLSAVVKPAEGMLLYGLVKDNGFKTAVEVGCANGASASFICAAMEPVSSEHGLAAATGLGEQQGPLASPTSGDVLGKGTSLLQLSRQAEWVAGHLKSKQPLVVSIDPFQTQQWLQGGQMNVAAGKYSTPHVLMECDGSLGLSMLVHERCQFDLVFLDGMHLFDYTVMDLLLADQCCRVGGVIVLDDLWHPGVAASLAYAVSNYPHWELQAGVLASQKMATFIKRAPDGRRWDFHGPVPPVAVATAASGNHGTAVQEEQHQESACDGASK